MGDDVRAAAERLAHGDLTSDRWCSDVREVAAAWLADHRPDDAEPLTVAWLKAVGFSRFMQPAASNHVSIARSGANLTRWDNKDTTPDWSCQVGAAEPEFILIPSTLCPETRGDVRALCRRLKLVLTEPNA